MGSEMCIRDRQPKKHFDVVTYTGNGGTQSIDSLDFSPDLVWIKDRSATNEHNLYDTQRGPNQKLIPNSNSAETTVTNVFNSFDDNGFSIGDSSIINANSNNYVAWCWDAGDTTVTNNDGTIESQVRASQEAGFSVVTYTGDGGNSSFGHGLGAKPNLVIVKSRSNTSLTGWMV